MASMIDAIQQNNAIHNLYSTLRSRSVRQQTSSAQCPHSMLNAKAHIVHTQCTISAHTARGGGSHLLAALAERRSGPSIGCLAKGSAVLYTDRRMKSLRCSWPRTSQSTYMHKVGTAMLRTDRQMQLL
eukprot:scaffold184028_cov27-Tisochrysis_lutea.AAC.1